jgi:hypothetical protein
MGMVESAFLLASLCRLVRSADLLPLSPIRSLAYFRPVIEELLANSAPENYLEYLHLKLRSTSENSRERGPADVPKNFQMICCLDVPNSYPF